MDFNSKYALKPNVNFFEMILLGIYVTMNYGNCFENNVRQFYSHKTQVVKNRIILLILISAAKSDLKKELPHIMKSI